MRINNDEFPVVVEAYDNRTSDRDERFVAEQVVYSQDEVENFRSRYSGMLIKARTINNDEIEVRHTGSRHTTRRSGAGVWLFVMILLLAAIAFGWYTGWIQKTFHINI
ncbi:MAG TPA: hypothetical protein VJT83_09500 [Chitinophagaceae bacterium]|nr:hypothetical protein [Chitinophagaceae bacterium]